jgi:hypothetical protein
MTDAAENLFTFQRRASPDRLTVAEAIRGNVLFYPAEAGTTIDHLMTPPFWSKVVSKLKPLFRIEVVDDELTYFAEFIVLSVGPDGARLAPLRGVELQGAGARDAMPRNAVGVQAVYRGPYLQWVAVRGDVVLKDKFPSEADCRRWIAGHLKTVQS